MADQPHIDLEQRELVFGADLDKEAHGLQASVQVSYKTLPTEIGYANIFHRSTEDTSNIIETASPHMEHLGRGKIWPAILVFVALHTALTGRH